MAYSQSSYINRVWTPASKSSFCSLAAKVVFYSLALIGAVALIQLFPSLSKVGRMAGSVASAHGGETSPADRSPRVPALRPPRRLPVQIPPPYDSEGPGSAGPPSPPGLLIDLPPIVDGSGCPPVDPYCDIPTLSRVETQPAPGNSPPDVKPPNPAPPVVPAPVAPAPGGVKSKPVRDPTWAPEQRPLSNSEERKLTSHVYEELSQHSMTPPMAFSEMTSDPKELAELQSRLIIGIGLGVHSGKTKVEEQGLVSLPVFNTLIPTFLPVIQPTHIYRFYFAFDHDDPIYENADMRAKIEDEFYRLIAEESGKRWHPEGHVAGTTIDDSTLLVTLHFVHCDYKGKPAWAHNDAVVAAYKEGADYVYRTNDDTAFPTVPDWVDKFVLDMRSRDIPNLGVVGPACGAGANWILTHDFTHRTHVVIFGFEYPRSLPDWSSDDWVTFVYGQFNLMSRREDVPVEHRLHGQRYKEQPQYARLSVLNTELANGIVTINKWVQEKYGKTLPSTPKHVECC
jgi:hypothetical protein